MDRRQEKTRKAVFSAFTKLLSEYRYEKITVQKIIDEADIGRSTFYAHFETKDELLNTICEELFGHVIDSAMKKILKHGLSSGGDDEHSVFCHLLQHLEQNDNNIQVLLSCESRELFMGYFRENLNGLIRSQFLKDKGSADSGIPEDFLINHISGSFVEMLLWWLKDGKKYTAEELDTYFIRVIGPVLDLR